MSLSDRLANKGQKGDTYRPDELLERDRARLLTPPDSVQYPFSVGQLAGQGKQRVLDIVCAQQVWHVLLWGWPVCVRTSNLSSGQVLVSIQP